MSMGMRVSRDMHLAFSATLGLARAGWTGHEELLQEYDVARV